MIPIQYQDSTSTTSDSFGTYTIGSITLDTRGYGYSYTINVNCNDNDNDNDNDTSGTTEHIDELEKYLIRKAIHEYEHQKLVSALIEIKKQKLAKRNAKRYCKQNIDLNIISNHSIKPYMKYIPKPEYKIQRYRGSLKKYQNRNMEC